MQGIYEALLDVENGSESAVLCTIISTSGSTPRKTGAKMLVYKNGSIAGTIGGGALEKAVIEQALDVFQTKKSKVIKHNLVNEFAMCCGGSVQLFIEPIMNKKKLYIFGAGHIGRALAKFGVDLDFNVSLIDERYDALEDFQVQNCKVMIEQHVTAIEKLIFDDQTFVVILTHDHQYDREILAMTSKLPHQYLGMIGSQRKVEIAKKNLLTINDIDDEILNQVNMPIGLDIKVNTPEEIAVSILAKIIDVRNRQD